MRCLDKSYQGTVSHGTMIADDIVDAIDTFAQGLPEGYKEERQAIESLIVEHNKAKNVEEEEYLLYEDIFCLLDEIAPEGYYFGSHPGDGADFGFWQCEEEDI